MRCNLRVVLVSVKRNNILNLSGGPLVERWQSHLGLLRVRAVNRLALMAKPPVKSSRSLLIRSSKRRISGIIGTRRISQVFVPVAGSPKVVNSPFSKLQSRPWTPAASPFSATAVGEKFNQVAATVAIAAISLADVNEFEEILMASKSACPRLQLWHTKRLMLHCERDLRPAFSATTRFAVFCSFSYKQYRKTG